MKTAVGRTKTTLSRAAFIAVSVLLTWPVAQAAAADLCANVRGLAELARTGFDGKPAPDAVREIAAHVQGSDIAADCRIIIKPDTKSHMCMWTFAYRSDSAAAGFERLIGDLKSCFDGREPTREDIGVNHPDSYDASRFDIDGVRISVSIKDKAALEKTFVFLWVEGD